MAQAEITTVPREVVTVVEEKQYTLTLTEDEATFLRTLLYTQITGGSKNKWRELSDGIELALHKAGAKEDYTIFAPGNEADIQAVK